MLKRVTISSLCEPPAYAAPRNAVMISCEKVVNNVRVWNPLFQFDFATVYQNTSFNSRSRKLGPGPLPVEFSIASSNIISFVPNRKVAPGKLHFGQVLAVVVESMTEVKLLLVNSKLKSELLKSKVFFFFFFILLYLKLKQVILNYYNIINIALDLFCLEMRIII
jgi:hypothetical protein